MVSLKRSGREIPALINHLQIIPVQTLSVQIDNGYLIQKKCLVSQSSMEDAGGWESQNKTINQTTKHTFFISELLPVLLVAEVGNRENHIMLL